MPTTEARAAALYDRLREIAPDGSVGRGQIRLVRAPGRVNLIGEHTDYNLGYVMPAAISLETWAASVPRGDSLVRILSMQEDETLEFDLTAIGPPTGTWVDYVRGIASVLSMQGVRLRGVAAVVDSDIPAGAGLSSSAALELAAAWTLTADASPPLSAMALALSAQRAENEYVGVRSGLMDQFASSHGRAGAALVLDCRSLEYDIALIPDGLTLVALDTRSPHRLGASEYNSRRAQCEGGVAAIAQLYPSVRSLRDVTLAMLDEVGYALDVETLKRCRHVVAENERVLLAADALRSGDLESIGRIFGESHASLRDLYEVSSPELDALVDIATGVPGVIGARMTGAGFGGCTVNIVRGDAVDDLRRAVEREYPRRCGRQPGFHIVEAVNGAGPVETAA